MKKNLLFYILIISFNNTLSQPPSIQWQKTIGGIGTDYGRSIQTTSDNGYIVAGSTTSNNGDITGNNGEWDYWIVKLNNQGIIQWQKNLGGIYADEANQILNTSDGGFIVVGYTMSNNGDVTGNHGSNDIWVVKLSNLGIIQWQKCLGGSGIDIGFSILQTNDGYIVAGRTGSNNGDVAGNHGGWDYWVAKLNSQGAIQWQKTLGGSNNDFGTNIQSTSDGGYIVVGYSSSNNGDVTGNHGGDDIWVVKLNSQGAIQWQKTLGGTNNDFGWNIQSTSDGGYIVVGNSLSNNGDVTGNHGGNDIWIVKLSNIGIIQWQKCLGGTDSDIGFSIQQTNDGYIVAGYTMSSNGDVTVNNGTYDAWLVKLNNQGIIQWQKNLGGTDVDTANQILNTSDGGYILIGNSLSNNGDVTGNQGNSDIWIVKLYSNDLQISKNEIQLTTIAPNPASTEVNINFNTITNLAGGSINIINALGQSVATTPITASGTNTTLSLATWGGTGMYFVQIINPQGQIVDIKKIILQ